MSLWKGFKPACKRSLQFSPTNHNHHQQPVIVLQRVVLIITVLAALCCAQIAVLRSAWRGDRDPIPTVISAEVPLPRHLHAADWIDASGHVHTATLDIAALPVSQGSRATRARRNYHLGHSCLLERLEHAYAEYAANHTGRGNTTADHPSPADTHVSSYWVDPDCPPLDCSTLLGDIPKVALLFLTRGPMHHEWLWHDWLDEIQHHLPIDAIQQLLCHAPPHTQHILLDLLRSHCASATPGGSVVDRQHLFSVYVHAPPNFSDYAVDSMFRSRLVPHRVMARWGSFSLVEASRYLLAAALEDPRNQRFVLLSESCVPLYAPQVVYMQLMSETKSRLDACGTTDINMRRHSGWMALAGVKREHWRKSWQWWMLIRSHAELAVEEHTVADAFRRYCFDDGWHMCYSDEHYFPTLLALHGLEGQTSCSRGLTYTDWSQGRAHPRTFTPQDVSWLSVRVWRQPQKRCAATGAVTHARQAFAPLDTLTLEGVCEAGDTPGWDGDGVDDSGGGGDTSGGGDSGGGDSDGSTAESTPSSSSGGGSGDGSGGGTTLGDNSGSGGSGGTSSTAAAGRETEGDEHDVQRDDGQREERGRRRMLLGVVNTRRFPFQPMSPDCPLFARKVPPEALEALHAALYNCSSLLYIVNQEQCLGDPSVDPTREIQLNVLALRAARELDTNAERMKILRQRARETEKRQAMIRAREIKRQLNLTTSHSGKRRLPPQAGSPLSAATSESMQPGAAGVVHNATGDMQNRTSAGAGSSNT